MESALSPLYTRWLEELIGSPAPTEPRSTCSDCAMCKKLDPPHEADFEFNPRVKCCSFNPKLPNFLVGGILQNDDPDFFEGREQFEREALKQAISPYDIKAPWIYWVHFYDRPFGTSERVRCPYYIDRDGGLCAIYQYRNSRCSTWFCKYEFGGMSFEFWQSVDTLFTALEDGLARWCVETIDLKRSLDPTDFPSSYWGVWVGRQPEFFRRCWNLVHQLSVHEAIRNAGEAVQPLANAVVRTFAEIQRANLPEVLYCGKFTTVPIGANRARVRSYSKLDPIDLDANLVEALFLFDGRPVKSVVQNLTERGVQLDEKILRKLYEFKILVSEGAGQRPAVHNAGVVAGAP
jgi:hypothetical protein